MKIVNTVSVAIICLVVAMMLFGCGGDEHAGQAKTPSGSDAQKGRLYEEVVKDFEDRGFINVKTERIEDLITGWLTEDGEVEKVTVGGDEEYVSDTWVANDTEVVIYYHTFPPEEETTEATEVTNTTEAVEETSAVKETTQKKKTEGEKDRKKLDSFVGKKCFDVMDDIKDMGYTPIFLAANTEDDMTSSIEYEIEEGYTESNWIISSMTDVDVDDKTVEYIVTSQWMRDNLY